MGIAEIGKKKPFTGCGQSAMLVERSREFWSLVGQIRLPMHKFYDAELVLNQGWFGGYRGRYVSGKSPNTR
jgi:hypothetical protein